MSKLESAVEALGAELRSDVEGRKSFVGILAFAIIDEIERKSVEDRSVTLTEQEIIDVAYNAAEDFTLTLEVED